MCGVRSGPVRPACAGMLPLRVMSCVRACVREVLCGNEEGQWRATRHRQHDGDDDG